VEGQVEGEGDPLPEGRGGEALEVRLGEGVREGEEEREAPLGENTPEDVTLGVEEVEGQRETVWATADALPPRTKKVAEGVLLGHLEVVPDTEGDAEAEPKRLLLGDWEGVMELLPDLEGEGVRVSFTVRERK
jgi:hypothetical protein